MCACVCSCFGARACCACAVRGSARSGRLCGAQVLSAGPLGVLGRSVHSTRKSDYQYPSLRISVPVTPIMSTRYSDYQYPLLSRRATLPCTAYVECPIDTTRPNAPRVPLEHRSQPVAGDWSSRPPAVSASTLRHYTPTLQPVALQSPWWTAAACIGTGSGGSLRRTVWRSTRRSRDFAGCATSRCP
jgi:hypothetical protein